MYTQNDLNTFTHILYLNVPAEIVMQHRMNDIERNRPFISITHLRKWQEAKKIQLRRFCLHHDILFSLVSPYSTLLSKISTLLNDFRHHNEKYNLSHAESRLNEIIAINQCQLKTVLIMNADRTLIAENTNILF